MFSQQKLVPKIAVVRKEEGATAAASHLPSLSGQSRLSFCGPDGQRSSMEGSKTVGNSHYIPLMSYLRETPAIIRIQLIGPPKQMKQMTLLTNAAESENRLKT